MLRASSLLALAALCFGCSSPRTEVLVVVDTDLAVPTELDSVLITVDGPSGTTQTAMGDLDSPGALPATVGLVHEGGELGPLRVRADGLLGGSVVVSRAAELSFVPEQTLVLRMFLTRDCVGVSCADGQTCAGGACRAVAVPPEELTEWTGTPPRLDGGARPGDDGGPREDAGPGMDAGPEPDAGAVDGGPPPADAGSDAGALPDGGPPTTDAGAMCASGACGPSCTCEPGCDCALGCTGGGDCDATCTGSGTTCAVNTRDASNASGTCSGGASCAFDATDVSNYTATCEDASTCVVDCEGVANCDLACESGSMCTLRCTDVSNCDLTGCPGGMRETCMMGDAMVITCRTGGCP